jgi:hypothetical protein
MEIAKRRNCGMLVEKNKEIKIELRRSGMVH